MYYFASTRQKENKSRHQMIYDSSAISRIIRVFSLSVRFGCTLWNYLLFLESFRLKVSTVFIRE